MTLWGSLHVKTGACKTMSLLIKLCCNTSNKVCVLQSSLNKIASGSFPVVNVHHHPMKLFRRTSCSTPLTCTKVVESSVNSSSRDMHVMRTALSSSLEVTSFKINQIGTQTVKNIGQNSSFRSKLLHRCQLIARSTSYCSPSLLSTVHLDSSRVLTRDFATGIQKHVSSLTAKRPMRKKASRTAQKEMDEHIDKVVAYAVAEELDLSQLQTFLHEQGLYEISELPIDAQDALHIRAKYAVDEKMREIFFFRDGSVVFWSIPEVERKEVLKFLRRHDIGRYNLDLILREREEMDVSYIKGSTSVLGDILQLNEETEEAHRTLEKYAFSNALAQSVKLAIWEASLKKFVDSIEFVSEDLRDGKKIGMSRREVLRKTGELFALRHLINLSSDLLDTPDFYWDRAILEPLYRAVCNHLDISRRTKVMNEKLSHCCELTELLSSHLNDAHHTRLEVMIIVLILVEVIFEIVHYLERFIDSQSEPVQTAESLER